MIALIAALALVIVWVVRESRRFRWAPTAACRPVTGASPFRHDRALIRHRGPPSVGPCPAVTRPGRTGRPRADRPPARADPRRAAGLAARGGGVRLDGGERARPARPRGRRRSARPRARPRWPSLPARLRRGARVDSDARRRGARARGGAPGRAAPAAPGRGRPRGPSREAEPRQAARRRWSCSSRSRCSSWSAWSGGSSSAVLAAGFRAEQRVRAEALRAVGASGRTVLVSVTERGADSAAGGRGPAPARPRRRPGAVRRREARSAARRCRSRWRWRCCCSSARWRCSRLGRVQLASARAQTAADLGGGLGCARAAGPAGRGRARPGPRRRRRWRARLAAVADAAARPAGARVEACRAAGRRPGRPTAVEVTVSVPGPRDARVRAVARAGLVAPAVAGDGRDRAGRTGGGYSGPLVYRDGKPMCPAVGAAFDLMDAAARAEGVDLVVVSGFRSDAEQAVLFARHPDPKWVAPPGRSRHRDATELDLNMHNGGGGAYAWLSRNGSRFGFVQRYSWEPWHWGYLPGCGGRTRSRGSAALPAAGPRRARSRTGSRTRFRATGRRGGGGERGRARPPGGAAAVRVRLRPARREPGRRPGDRPAHAGHGPGPRGARPLRPRPRRSRRRRGCSAATCGRSVRCRWRWRPTTPGRGRCAATAGCRPTARPRPTSPASWRSREGAGALGAGAGGESCCCGRATASSEVCSHT